MEIRRGLWPALFFLPVLWGCGEDRPRTHKEIFKERSTLPRLFLTTPSGNQVIAPGDKGVFVDEASGEVCWPALQCANPQCPGRGEEGEPFLFSYSDPGVVVQSDGSIIYDAKKGQSQDPHAGQCPKCLEIRDLKKETPAEQQQYNQWVQPYVLPKTERRIEELKAEEERLKEYIKERKYRS